MTDPAKTERRKTDYEVRVIFVLLSIIIGGLTWWMTKIDAKAEKIPVLEANMKTLQGDVTYIRDRIDSILSNWRK